MAGSDGEISRRVADRDLRAARDPSLSGSGSARRIPPSGSGTLGGGGGATVLPPVSHVQNPSGSYYGYPHSSSGYCYPYYGSSYCGYGYGYGYCGSYPWFGFSIGFSFGYGLYGCYGYPYYGYPYYGYSYYGSPYYWGWYGYPCYSVAYASPYYYRYRYSYYPYYSYAPLYYYDDCYYAFTPTYGFVPYYESSYAEYERIQETPAPEAAAEPRAERDLSAAELRFCEGWSLLRAGDEENAAQVLYTSTIELDRAALPHWFLAVALAGTDDIALAQRTLGEVLRIDPDFLRHRWNPVAHLGADGDRVLREKLAALRVGEPLAAAPLALEAALSLLAGDSLRVEALRGLIAESLIVDPEAPGLVEALAEIRRRGEAPEGGAEGHPNAVVEAWLASPSCESIPSLGLSGG